MGLRFAGVDYEIEQPLVSANSNHVSRRYVTEYGIGEFKPKAHFLRIAGKELSNEVGNICDFTQSLRNMRIELLYAICCDAAIIKAAIPTLPSREA
jgi:hypothetical protein